MKKIEDLFSGYKTADANERGRILLEIKRIIVSDGKPFISWVNENNLSKSLVYRYIKKYESTINETSTDCKVDSTETSTDCKVDSTETSTDCKVDSTETVIIPNESIDVETSTDCKVDSTETSTDEITSLRDLKRFPFFMEYYNKTKMLKEKYDLLKAENNELREQTLDASSSILKQRNEELEEEIRLMKEEFTSYKKRCLTPEELQRQKKEIEVELKQLKHTYSLMGVNEIPYQLLRESNYIKTYQKALEERYEDQYRSALNGYQPEPEAGAFDENGDVTEKEFARFCDEVDADVKKKSKYDDDDDW